MKDGEVQSGGFRFDFEDLRVYQKALALIDEIFALVEKLPSKYHFSVGDNLIRAGLSVANNLAEGNDKKSSRERHRYFCTSSDSARECASVFIVLRRRGFIEETQFVRLKDIVREITSMIRGLIKG